MTLPDKLKALRKEKGLTQAEAGAKIQVTKSSLAAYEEGRAAPPMDKLKNIIDFYKVPKKQVYDFLFS